MCACVCVCVSMVGEVGWEQICILFIFSIDFCVFLASQTWVLGRLLPVMIGHLVPLEDPYWGTFFAAVGYDGTHVGSAGAT